MIGVAVTGNSGLGVSLGVALAVAVGLIVAVAVLVGARDGVVDGVVVGVLVGLGDAVGVEVSVGAGVLVGLGVRDGVALGVLEGSGDGVGDAVGLGVKLGATVGAVVRVGMGVLEGSGVAAAALASVETGIWLVTVGLTRPASAGWIRSQFWLRTRKAKAATIARASTPSAGRSQSRPSGSPHTWQRSLPRLFSAPHARQRTRRGMDWSLPHSAQMRCPFESSAPQCSHS